MSHELLKKCIWNNKIFILIVVHFLFGFRAKKPTITITITAIMNLTELWIQAEPLYTTGLALGLIIGIILITYLFYLFTVFIKGFAQPCLGPMCGMDICSINILIFIQYGSVFFVLAVLAGAYFSWYDFSFVHSFDIIVITLGLLLAFGAFLSTYFKDLNLKNKLIPVYHWGDVWEFEKKPKVLIFLMIKRHYSYWWRFGYKGTYRISLAKLSVMELNLLFPGDKNWVQGPSWIVNNKPAPRGFFGIKKKGYRSRNLTHTNHNKTTHTNYNRVTHTNHNRMDGSWKV